MVIISFMAVRPVRLEPKSASLADAHGAIECVGRLAELYQRRREQLAESVGLTDPQWGVLEEIATEHFMPSLFARRRDSSAAAVSKVLRQLVDKGLVVAAVGRDDARQRKYSLTAKGRRVMERLREGREDAIRQVWLPLDGDGLRAFSDFGRRLIDRLESYAASAEGKKE
jgi:DNA-binding MarR family transcriptional regulator